MKAGYVYIVGDEVSSKVGFSTQPKIRVNTIKSNFDNMVGEVDVFVSELRSDAFNIESKAHIKMDYCLIKGELFNMPFESAKALLTHLLETNKCAQVNDSLLTPADIDALDDLLSHDKLIEIEGEPLMDLTSIWSYTNIMRAKEGKAPSNMSRFLNGANAKEFIRISKGQLLVTGAGNSKRTYCDISTAIYCATSNSTPYNMHVIKNTAKQVIARMK